MNKQTEQMIEFIDDNEEVKSEVMQSLESIQWQATINGSIKLKRFIYAKLVEDTQKNYSIIHDFMTHCMTLVEWEKVAAYYLEQKGS